MERQPNRIRGMMKAVVARALSLGAEIREEAYRAYGILKGPSILDRMSGNENTPTNV
jgi:hypothetical protein